MPLEVPYSPNHFLGWDFFSVSYSKPALKAYCPNEYTVHEGQDGKHLRGLFDLDKKSGDTTKVVVIEKKLT